MAVALKPHANEHWLTLLNCYRCGRAPEESPIFKCAHGHTVCNGCYNREVKGNTIESCPCCGSCVLTRKEISMDLVHKLTTKPGIGRPRRYAPKKSITNNHTPSSVITAVSVQSHIDCAGQYTKEVQPDDDAVVTLEKLFQMPRSRVTELLDSDTMRRIKSKEDCTQVLYELGRQNPDFSRSEYRIGDTDPGILPKVFSTMCLISKKPVTCPITECSKIVAQSSFQSHFKFDHSDLPRILSERGKDFVVLVDADIFAFNSSHCIGVATIYTPTPPTQPTTPTPSSSSSQSARPAVPACVCSGSGSTARCRSTLVDSALPSAVPGHFWIMVSGSVHTRPENAYALFWVFSCSEEMDMCTMELSSRRDVFSSSIQCSVHGLQDSQDILELAGSLNCLFVPYGALRTMLSCGTAVNLRVTIH